MSIRDEWGERFGRSDPKIVCVGLNYGAHAGESGGDLPKAPLLFGKFANTLVGDGDPIVLPFPEVTDATSFRALVPEFADTPLDEGVALTVTRFRELLAAGLVTAP